MKAIVAVNKYIEADTVLNSLMKRSFKVQPAFASEPLEGKKSYPYIRYLDVPAIDSSTMNIRRDQVQYWIGDKDLVNLSKMAERLIYLLDSDENNIDKIISDPSNTVKIHSIRFISSSVKEQPSQDLGVWEQAVRCEITYVISNKANLWS